MSAKELRGAALIGCVVSLLACSARDADAYSAEAQRAQADDQPLAGLFTPGNTIGYQSAASSAADGGEDDAEMKKAEAAIRAAGMMDRCALADAPEGTPGVLSFSFQTRTYDGFYTPENCGAVWIEDADGQYIATAQIWAGVRRRNLFIWDARRCKSDSPDAITSATLSDHSTPHEGTWDGKDHAGHVVPDGTYVLNIEVTEDEFDFGRRAEIPFDKGAQAVMLSPDDQASVTDLVLSYAPAGSEGSGQ